MVETYHNSSINIYIYTEWPDENETEALTGTATMFLKNSAARAFLIKWGTVY